MKDLLAEAVRKFNEKARIDPALQKELEGVERTVLIDLKGGAKYHFVLRESRIDGLLEGPVDVPDVTILTDEETMAALLRREMGPMKAYATQKLRIKASLEDVLRLRKFF